MQAVKFLKVVAQFGREFRGQFLVMGDRMVLVYGGNGALGSTIISYFKKYGHVISII